MPEIRVLPETVANQIAAGEVVERPASVVKELLENSLDAGATRIGIEFRHGGKALIAVEDDGCGMTPDQALMALEMHATSKIRNAGDLDEIRTFGFRGEAVPSIASVSRFTLRTRTAEALGGTELVINAGKLVHQKQTGMAPGTRIEVANLFHPVPARLKFLKSQNTESAHITRLVRLYAVAHPGVGFRLIEDGQEVFRSPADATLHERVREIWGAAFAADLAPLEPAEASGMRLQGLLGKAGASRATRQEMVTIVNGRPVDSRVLAYALTESYHTLLPRGRYPLAFLLIDIEPHWVDVNVHPTKREVRFRDEGRVRQFVITTVLRHHNLAPAPPTPPEPERLPDMPAHTGIEAGASMEPAPDATAGGVDATTPPAPTPPEPGPGEPSARAQAPRISPMPPAVASPATPPAGAYRFDWRLAGRLTHNLALFETPAGALVILGLRAAAARIWYERVLQRVQNGQDEPGAMPAATFSQQLLLAIPMELDPIVASTLRERQALLQQVGFHVEEFGRNFFRIQATPDWLPSAMPPEETLRDMLAQLTHRPGDLHPAHPARELLAKIAAEHAAAGAIPADPEYAISTARELFHCRQPTVCPRGKPVFTELTRSELARRLGL
ncbi:MAG: DNA mismatch repair endonuclease MutL [Puniceicoccales bacterium]|jgi:DNA mismatch repair protein MutL|nr:DNA mismatch repair endonuclease MutL [Puniceicoccales bacterium]